MAVIKIPIRSTGFLPYVSEIGPTNGEVIPQATKVAAASCPAIAIDVPKSLANITRSGPGISITVLAINATAANDSSVHGETPRCWTAVKFTPRQSRRFRGTFLITVVFNTTPFNGFAVSAVFSGSGLENNNQPSKAWTCHRACRVYPHCYDGADFGANQYISGKHRQNRQKFLGGE